MFFNKKEKLTVNIELPKEEYFDFDRIATYYQWKSDEQSFQNINDHTWDDLDMNEVFMYLDRTHSRPGQQYLYYLLRSIPLSERIEEAESIINNLDTSDSKWISVIDSLQRLNSRGSYFLHNLFSDDSLKKPSWFKFVYPLLILTIGSALLSTIFPSALLITLAFIVANFIVHYLNKSKLMEYSNAISQLKSLDKACKRLSSIQIYYSKSNFQKARKTIKGLVRKSTWLHDTTSNQNDLAVIGDSIIEIIKASLLVEPILLHLVSKEIKKRKEHLKVLFEILALTDACISIKTIRSTTIHCIPKPCRERILETLGCYHPLIINSQSNSIAVPKHKSVLISGSNMSGKTTFIRTIGVNALLSQTINTVFATSWKAPRFKIFSAIRISDNLLNDESFYQKEVKVLKEMVDESKSEEKKLFLIDELYKGTNSAERIAAGVSVLSFIQNQHSLVCASTHDLELTEFLKETYENYHFTEQVSDSEIKFDYKLKKGKLQNTNAIKILEANDYPNEIVLNAKEIVQMFLNKK